MKARIPKDPLQPLVLAYGMEKERLARLEALLQGEQIPLKALSDADLCQKTGFLCGLPGYLPGEPELLEPFPHEALLLCGFGDRTLDRLLSLLRQNDLRVARKAALTAVNRDWPLGQLLKEIDREHEIMSRR